MAIIIIWQPNRLSDGCGVRTNPMEYPCCLEEPEANDCDGEIVKCNCGHYACEEHRWKSGSKVVCEDCLWDDPKCKK